MVVAIPYISNGQPCNVSVSSVLYALWQLMRYDLTRRLNGLAGIRGMRASVASRPAIPSEVLSAAVEVACTYYFHRVKCLQRSVVCRELLRRHGFEAEVVI